MNPSNITRLTATGDVITRTAYLRSVTLTAGDEAASVVVRAGGSNGTIVLTLKADPTAGPPVAAAGPLCDALCPGGIHVTLTGNDAEVTVVHA